MEYVVDAVNKRTLVGLGKHEEEERDVLVMIAADAPFPTLEPGERYIVKFQKVERDFEFGPARPPNPPVVPNRPKPYA